MHQIIKDDQVISIEDKLQYVRKQPRNGIIINCPENVAQGVVVNDIIYHLEGRPELPGHETVSAQEFSGAGLIAELDNTVLDFAYRNILLENGLEE